MRDEKTVERIGFNYSYLVYGLSEGDTDKIRYIGITSDLGKRVREHLKDASRNLINTHKKKWVVSCSKNEIPINAIVLEDGLTQDMAFKKEIEYIKLFKSFGAKLVNGTLGGDGVRFTDEIRKKIGAKNKGRKVSDETIERLRKANTGKRASEETKKKMSDTQKRIGNRPIITAETRKRCSERMKGLPSLMKGKTHSDFTKQKIRNAKIGIYSNNGRAINQYDINNNFITTYKSITDAAKATNAKNIFKCVIGERNQSGGFIWKYKVK